LLHLVTQIRTTVKSTVGGDLGTFGNGFRKSFQGSSRIKDEMAGVLEIRRWKSDLHQAAELGGQYDA
jgi:hypothetical protein